MAGKKKFVDGDKKRLFAQYYCGHLGRTVEAMRADGIPMSLRTAERYVADSGVRDMIRARNEAAESKGIASREERQRFWTRVMNGEEKQSVVTESGKVVSAPAKMTDRLKASELLGKSFKDFVDRHEISGELSLSSLIKEINGDGEGAD